MYKGIILAAGRGSRMGDLTLKLPKCRTIFKGKELLDWQIDGLSVSGLDEISIVRGYLAETFKKDVGAILKSTMVQNKYGVFFVQKNG